MRGFTNMMKYGKEKKMIFSNFSLLGMMNAGKSVPPPVPDTDAIYFKFYEGDEYLYNNNIVFDNNNKLCLALRIRVDDNYDAGYTDLLSIKYTNQYKFTFNFYRDGDSNVYCYFELADMLGGATAAYSSTAYLTEEWYTLHLIIDRTQAVPNDTAKLYVNGVQDTLTFSANSQLPFGHGDSYDITTGLKMQYTLDYMALLIDKTWTQKQINAMVTNKQIWPYTYYWPINEGSGNTIHDLGKFGKDLTNVGGGWRPL